MDREKLLAELDASDAICAAATDGPWYVKRQWSNGCEIVPRITCNHNPSREYGWIADLVGAPYLGYETTLPNADFIAHARTELPSRNQQLREALSRIAELEAVVVPLEKILTLGYVACIDIDGDYCVECYRIGIQSADYRGNTLAEALAEADKAMEDKS